MSLPCPILYRTWPEVWPSLRGYWPFSAADTVENPDLTDDYYDINLSQERLTMGILMGTEDPASTGIPLEHQGWRLFLACLPTACFLVCVGLTESLMTLKEVQSITERGIEGLTLPVKPLEIPGVVEDDEEESGVTDPKAINSNSKTISRSRNCFPKPLHGFRYGPMLEVLAQGLANLASGFFGTMGGCCLVGQSMMNVTGGGNSRLAGVIAAFGTLSVIMLFGRFMQFVPISALMGVMFFVSYMSFDWASLGAAYRAFFKRREVKLGWLEEGSEGKDESKTLLVAGKKVDDSDKTNTNSSSSELEKIVVIPTHCDFEAARGQTQSQTEDDINKDTEGVRGHDDVSDDGKTDAAESKSESNSEESERLDYTRFDCFVVIVVMAITMGHSLSEMCNLATAVGTGCVLSNVERYIRRRVYQNQKAEKQIRKQKKRERRVRKSKK